MQIWGEAPGVRAGAAEEAEGMSQGNAAGKRVKKLRECMKEAGIDAWFAPSSDPHDSEYVDDHFKVRAWLTGFTGSAGTAVVTMDKAGLWTDGRYFLQAERQLAGSGITLYRMGEPGVPTVEEFLRGELAPGMTLGMDGACVTESLAERLERTGAALRGDTDLPEMIWEGRPEMSRDPLWVLSEEFAGKSLSLKMTDLRTEMSKMGVDTHILTTLDDIAWLLNIRGGDVLYTPVVLSFMIITMDGAELFVNPEKIGPEALGYLSDNGITVRPYEEIYEAVRSLENRRILLEKARVNMRIWREAGNPARNNVLTDAMNPTSRMKGIKNPVEIQNMRNCHHRDAVAMIRYIMWLKANVGRFYLDEFMAAKQLDFLRAVQQGNMGPSFATISAYGPNAAVVHYTADEEGCAELMRKGLYLVDSGGQYMDGTTDVTRTIALGELTDEERKCFTLVSVACLRLMNIRFPYGARGLTLDYAARGLLWQHGMDYNHGTGHGVAYVGTVHERPNGFRYKASAESLDTANAVLEPGMITSDEPGLYVEGKFGIRTENLILCTEDETNEFGRFLRFEPLTLVPMDREAFDTDYMTDEDIELLNRYHQMVYDEIAPLLTEPERDWLKEACAPLARG